MMYWVLRLILLFSGSLILNACYLNAKINSLNSKNSSESSPIQNESFNFTGIISDGVYYNSSTQSPQLSWNTPQDPARSVLKYQIALGNSYGATDILNWTDIGNVTSYQINNLHLSDLASYYPSVRAVDINNIISNPIFGDGWIVSTSILSFTPNSNVELLTGENLYCSASGGLPYYTYSDGGTNYINSITGLYSVPLGISPRTDFVKVVDSNSDMLQRNIKIRAFENKDKFLFDSTANNNSSGRAIAARADGIVITAGVGKTYYGDRFLIIKRSIDGGISWSVVKIEQINNALLTPASSIKFGLNNDVYIAARGTAATLDTWRVLKSNDAGQTWNDVDVVAGANNEAMDVAIDSLGNVFAIGSINLSFAIRKSSNGGQTWSTVDSFKYDSSYSSEGYGIGISPNGEIYATGVGNYASNAVWLTRKSIDGGLTWITVDAYRLFPASFKYAQGNKIKVDSAGNIFAVGYAYDSFNILHLLVRKSTDNGTSWVNSLDYNKAAGKHSRGEDIFINSNGKIFVIGNAYNSSSVQSAVIFYSSNSGGSWNLIDDFIAYVGFDANAYSIVADDLDNIYYIIESYDTAWKTMWITRKSTNLGSSWTTIDNYQLQKGIESYGYGISQDSGGLLYHVGEGWDSSASYWITRKSTDSGTTWSTSDSFQLAAGSQASASATATDNSGNVYVVGNAYDSSGYKHWIIRKSSNAGVSWSTIDNYQLVVNKAATAKAIMITTSGIIYVAGEARDSSNVTNWIVRKSINGGSSWSTIDSLIYSAGKTSSANAITINPTSGDIYVGGRGYDSTNVIHAITRKSTDSGNTWSTIDDYTSNGSSVYLNGLYMSATGKLYFAGESLGHWLVRSSNDGGFTWVTNDDFQWPSNTSTTAVSVAVNSSNQVFVAGYSSAGNYSHWIIRKSNDNGATWATVDDVISSTYKSYSSPAFIINCLNNQICVSGSGDFDFATTIGLQVRILSQ